MTATYIAADMSKGAIAASDRRGGGLRHPGEQRRDPARRPGRGVSVEKWDLVLAINLSSAFHTIAAALPGMRRQGLGRIIDIASAHGLTASPFKSAYVASKHAVVGLTKTVALETAGQGITVNAICPGYVLTPLVEAQIPDQMKVQTWTGKP